MSNRILELTRAIYNWGAYRGRVPFNPLAGLRGPTKERNRTRVLTENEIRAVWADLAQEPPHYALMYRLLFLTALRSGEVRALRKTAIDDSKPSRWALHISENKADRPFRLPLSSQARAVVEQMLRETAGEEWLIEAPRADGYMRTMGVSIDRIRERTDTDFNVHDIRRTVATQRTGAVKVSRFILGRILNHADPNVTAVYDQTQYEGEMVEALDAWALHLERILLNGPNVVPISQVPQNKRPQ